MKKIVLFLMTLLFITACSKNEFTPMTQEEMITQSYNEAFIKTFGQPAANQDWGFETIGISATRGAAVNSNQWFDGVTEQFKHLVKPADVTAREEEVVSDWFKAHKNPTCDEILLTEFFVQQVYFGTKEYTAKDNNGAEQKVIGGQHMDYLYAGTVDNKDHINNFNTSAPLRTATGLGNMQLMQNSSTANFGFHESFNSQNQRYYLEKDRNWVIKAISVDGVIGYYVGFDYESHGNQGNFEPDGYFDDRIVKIVPGDGYDFDIRIIAEDLSAKEGSDFDFNDVVFDAKFTSNSTALITLIAAGGTLPLTVAGQEVHSKFGVNTDVMVNTGAGPTKDPVIFSIGGINKSQNGKDIEIVVQKNGLPCVLTAQKGVPASKIGVPTTFDYCSERQDISKKYPLFSTWVQDDPDVVWWEP